MADGTFWPVPVTLSTTKESADSLKKNEEIALVDEESGELMATMKVTEKYAMSKPTRTTSASRSSRTNDVPVTRACRRSWDRPM